MQDILVKSPVRQHLIDPEICIRCNTCEATCPIGAITHDANNYVVDANTCNFCMDCVSPCPTGAIDNWFEVAAAFPVESQYEWVELPPRPVASSSHNGGHPASAGGSTRAPASAAEPRINLFNRENPARASVAGNYRITGPDATSDVRHIILDFGATPFPVLEGQIVGIVPPGIDAQSRPHAMRLYSVASARDGERPNTNNLALTVKRVVEMRPDTGIFHGVASNFLCDLQRGDGISVVGPFGATFLMPDDPDADILMVCTGTGAAPFRGFTERRRRTADQVRGKLYLYFGARTPNELPYFGPLQKVPASLMQQQLVYSRLANAPREYVQDRMRQHAPEIAALLQRDTLHIYMCGLRGLEEGVEFALTEIGRAHGIDWLARRQELREAGRYHVETY